MSLLDRILDAVGLSFDLDLSEPPFHRITDVLHLGGRPVPATVPLLEAAGITHVVSCLPATERAAMGFLTGCFATTFLSLDDRMHVPLDAAIATFSAVVAREAARGGQVLVHCQVGVSRSASLVLAHRMVTTDARFWETWCAVRARRPQVLPNIGFASQLQRLEHTRLGPRPAGEVSSLTRYLREACRAPVDEETLQRALERTGFDALPALEEVFGEVPRVVQGVRR
jgi:protein tyrosine phosphatase (PTP) superfamily phosphohydrolase (DUF442 family)